MCFWNTLRVPKAYIQVGSALLMDTSRICTLTLIRDASIMLQGYSNDASRVLQGCYSGIFIFKSNSIYIPEYKRMFQVYLYMYLRMFQVYLYMYLRMFQGCASKIHNYASNILFKGIFEYAQRIHQGCYKRGINLGFQGIFFQMSIKSYWSTLKCLVCLALFKKIDKLEQLVWSLYLISIPSTQWLDVYFWIDGLKNYAEPTFTRLLVGPGRYFTLQGICLLALSYCIADAGTSIKNMCS